jgi:hypothetical protein
MKIRTKTGQILHVEKNAVTQILVDAGLATIVTEMSPATGETTWTFGYPDEAADVKNVSIRLIAKCSRPYCMARFNIFYGKTAARTAKFCHCGRVDTCPPDTAKAYEKARERAHRD